MNVPEIRIRNAALAYSNKTVFSDINLDISAGKWIGLLGPSGIGKSSFLRMIAGLTLPQEQSGGILYADNNIPLNQQVAYMAQTDLLLPWLTVLGNVLLGCKLRPQQRGEKAAAIAKATSLLEQAGLKQAHHLYPHQLSGGMRQRVALVRTLMEYKPIVLMDEPFSALDAITRYKLQETAAALLKDKTVLFITHDPVEALRLADSIYIMQGHPAGLKQVVELTSLAPRSLLDPEVTNLQGLLYQELARSTGDAA